MTSINNSQFNLTNTNYTSPSSLWAPRNAIEMGIWAGLGLHVLYLGAFGNVLTLAVIIRSRWWTSGFHVLMVSMTIVDLLGTAIVHPHQLLNILLGPETFPFNYHPYCRMAGYISMIKHYLVPLHCCMIAINRFITIVLPHRYSSLTSQRAGIVMLVYCWTLPCILFTFPLAEVDGLFTNGRPFGNCTWAGYLGSQVLAFIIYFGLVYIPTVVIFGCYLGIFIYLKRADRKIFQQAGVSQAEIRRRFLLRMRRRIQVVKMMLVTFVAFMVCFLPVTTFFYIAKDINKGPNSTAYLWLIFVFWISSCCNTVIYSLMNKDFRDAYIEMLRLLRGYITKKLDLKNKSKNIAGAHLTHQPCNTVSLYYYR